MTRGDISIFPMTISAVLGAQWGDEGKGKLVDMLAGQFDVVARFNGGANAGHTVVVDGLKYALHLLPCGILYPDKVNIIGNGTVIHIPSLLDELKMMSDRGANITPDRLRISTRAHILFDFHQIIDGSQEKLRGANGIGTTNRGIGPCYSIKASRDNLRLGDLVGNWDTFQSRYRNLVESVQKTYQIDYKQSAEQELKRFETYRSILLPFIADTVLLLSSMLREKRSILAEGANAALLDLDFGTYPFVTSSTTTAGGICTGLGVPPRAIRHSIGVVKAYTTRVGSGPFPTELLDGIGEALRRIGHEFGTTTGRPRRCGWLDVQLLKYSHCLNGYDEINLTKLDVLSGLDEIKIGVRYIIEGKRLADGHMPSTIEELAKVRIEYETVRGWKEDISKCRIKSDLPEAARAYVLRIEELLGIPITYIGVGPGRHDMVSPISLGH